jgi:hypothetical protein
MILKAFSIRDQKADIYNTPFFANTHGEAERNFTSAVNDEKTQLWQYPEDFDLYHVGEYNNLTGVLEPLDTPKHMTKAIHVKRGFQPDQEKA